MTSELPSAEQRPRYVVGIGASAGGLDAIERFFDNLPPRTGMAFVVIQHLSPDFKSLMDELLARHTELPIRPVENGMTVEPDHVYLIPPKKEMIISGGRLLLSERDRQQELSLPIDTFFRSLAQDCGPRAIAIVLSGGGSDGSRGVRAVHDAGGLVAIQSVESAQFDGMPRMARDVGVASYVLSPDEIPRAILDHVEGTGASPSAAEAGVDSHGLAAVYQMLEDEFGIDFTHYKPSTVTRRIERRLQLSRVGNVDAYVERLKHGREELDLLYRDLLIGVTRFFRDEAAFKVLEETVFPELLLRAPRDAPLRLWIAGCATGEEVYSLAIVLHDLMSRVGERPIKIFATDVHRGSLDLAAAAVYDEHTVAAVSPERLERYFLRRGQHYQVAADLRQMVVFAQHNVVKDPPFTRVDLISCRNLLIYLQPPAQQKALSLFHFALNRGGVVFLGPSESPGLLARDFETIDRHWRIYRKQIDIRTPVDARLQPLRSSAPRTGLAASHAEAGRHSMSQLLGTYDALLDEFMPPSLLVNARHELVHAFSGASRFLKPRDGRQALDVLEMVDPGLRMALVGSLQRTHKEKSAIVFTGVRLECDDSTAYKVTIRPIKGRGGEGHTLISLEATAGGAPREQTADKEIDVGQFPREQLATLEAELSQTKENLQTVIEELASSNEELQAANEELLASNEELQSTNEELQSVNEELYTVNAEYQRKIGELTELTNDMDNLLSSTEVGSIFLDAQLRIRKFTPQIAESFKLLPRDISRSIETFTHTMDYPELTENLRRVLATGERVEREVRDAEGRYFFLRVLPYRAKGTIDGVVLTLIDVSGLKAAEDALFHERYLLNSLLATVPDAIYFKDARGRFIRANHAMATRLGLADPAELTGKTAFELPDQEAALALHSKDEAVLRSGVAQHYRLERRDRPVHDGGSAPKPPDGVTGWDLSTRLPLIDPKGRTVGIIGIFRDVSEQKRVEHKFQEAVRRRDQFLAMLSHELRNPLSAIVTATNLLKGGNLDRLGKLVRVLDRQSQQMARLLDDLLEVSRVTQDKIELRKRVLDVGLVARDAAEAARAQMEVHQISLAVEIEPSPLFVDGDPARLQQIVANLLHNAAKYTPRGGKVALVVTREAGRAVIRVRDDGAGIRSEMLDAVFDLFVQSNHTLDRAQGGLGVGLTLVRSLVTMHGGEVTAHSDGEGKGSTFVVRLPLTELPAEHEDSPGARPGPRLATGSSVVVVEDNRDTREMLCEILSLAGFGCESAEDGASGLQLIERARPDVAIIDLGLPEVDGFEMARRVRQSSRLPSIYLIALTGYGQPSDRIAALRAGFDEHMVKPADPIKLIRLLSGVDADIGPSGAEILVS